MNALVSCATAIRLVESLRVERGVPLDKGGRTSLHTTISAINKMFPFFLFINAQILDSVQDAEKYYTMTNTNGKVAYTNAYSSISIVELNILLWRWVVVVMVVVVLVVGWF